MQKPPIGFRKQVSETAECPLLFLRSVFALRLGLDDPGGKHRAERQRHEAREQNREGQHEAEFLEEASCLARQEGERNEDRGERGGGGNDGEKYLARADNGGRANAEPLVALSHDVLEHHDRVIHHHAGRQHQC